MLPTLVDDAPDGEAWVHEIKYDGYQTQLAVAGKDSRAFTRNGYDWTDKYGIVVAAARALKCRSAVIDGEMCVQDAAGVTDQGLIEAGLLRESEPVDDVEARLGRPSIGVELNPDGAFFVGTVHRRP